MVVETKANDDVTDQNAGKLAHALAHFEKLNELLKAAGEERRYHFLFLSPVDYDDFFAGLRERNLEGFAPTLQAALTT